MAVGNVHVVLVSSSTHAAPTNLVEPTQAAAVLISTTPPGHSLELGLHQPGGRTVSVAVGSRPQPRQYPTGLFETI